MKNSKQLSEQLTNEVKDWWNTNPYSYGLSQKKGRFKDVGDIENEKINADFFDNYMRKCRKLFDDAQLPNEKIAARFVPYADLQSKEVLDIACGFGWSLIELADSGAKVIGIDITPRAIEIARKHLAYRNLLAETKVMDAQKLEFPNDNFDYVHAWGCLMHMPQTEQAISEIYRVLKNGGKTSGYMYNRNSITFWWNRFFLKGILRGYLFRYKFNLHRLTSRFGDGASQGGNPLTKTYTPKQAEKMFKEAGFINVKFKPWGPPEMIMNFPSNRLPLGKILSYKIRKKIADHYGWGMIFTAEKSE